MVGDADEREAGRNYGKLQLIIENIIDPHCVIIDTLTPSRYTLAWMLECSTSSSNGSHNPEKDISSSNRRGRF